jgi:hypothetical protein
VKLYTGGSSVICSISEHYAPDNGLLYFSGSERYRDSAPARDSNVDKMLCKRKPAIVSCWSIPTVNSILVDDDLAMSRLSLFTLTIRFHVTLSQVVLS